MLSWLHSQRKHWRKTKLKISFQVRSTLFIGRPKAICPLPMKLERILKLDWYPWMSKSWKRTRYHFENNNPTFREMFKTYWSSEIPTRSSSIMGALPNTNTQSSLKIHYQPALCQKLNRNDLTLSTDSKIQLVINTISQKGKLRHRKVNLLD